MIKRLYHTAISRLFVFFGKKDINIDISQNYFDSFCGDIDLSLRYNTPSYSCNMYQLELEQNNEVIPKLLLDENKLVCDGYISKLSNWFKSGLGPALKQSMSFMLIIIMLAGLYLSSAKKADAGMIVGDHRYTSGAVAADMAQCAFLIGIWVATRWAMRTMLKALLINLTATCAASGGTLAFTCGAAWALSYTWVLLAEIAAAAALYGAWYDMDRLAKETRRRTHILNNFDEGKPDYCEKFDHRNKRYKFGSINSKYSDCNQTVYTTNEHFNQIAIYFDDGRDLNVGEYGADIIGKLATGSPDTSQYVWVSPYDCKTLSMVIGSIFGIEFSAPRWVCAYEEDGQLCADIVFCTSLEVFQFIKFVAPGMFFFNKVSGYVSDPIFDSSDGTRNCGKNPWTDSAQDDYKAGKGRCECACCPGTVDRPTNCDVSTVSSADGTALANDYPCTTYNERYRAHCIPRGIEKLDIDPPVLAPLAISAYCDAGVNVGYSPFPFSGKLMRCFEKTLNNVFYGTREVVEYAEDGKYLIEDGAIVMSLECAEGNVNSSGFCDSSMFMKAMDAYQDIIRMLLILFISFVGIRMMMGANYAFPDLFKMIMKVSLVAYFAMGDAWKDGYYTTLLSMGSELGAEYYALSDVAYATVSGSMQTTMSESTGLSTVECSVTAVGSASALSGSLSECNFTSDSGYDGVEYTAEDQHYAVWDSLDCKFATYTGFTVTKTFPYIVSFAWGMLLSVSTGFMTLIAALAIIFSSLVIMLTALYVGILVLFNITILIYIAPLVIPLVLFEQTKSIFNKWLSLLLGYSLQPMVLFALLSFTYAILDQLFMTTMPQIFSSQVSESEIGLGIVGYKISSSSDFSTLVISMIKFTIAMVIMSSLFTKAIKILEGLTGANVGNMPDISKAVSGAAAGAAKFTGNTAKLSGRYAKDRLQKMGGEKKRAKLMGDSMDK